MTGQKLFGATALIFGDLRGNSNDVSYFFKAYGVIFALSDVCTFVVRHTEAIENQVRGLGYSSVYDPRKQAEFKSRLNAKDGYNGTLEQLAGIVKTCTDPNVAEEAYSGYCS